MFELSIDTKAFAEQVREIKIHELTELIKHLEKDFKKNKDSMFLITKNYERARISELKRKLKSIKK